jgi:hypothetical protein
MTMHLLRIGRLLLLTSSLLVAAAYQAHAGEMKSSDGHLVRWDAGLDEVGERVARQLPIVSRQVAASLGFDFVGGPAEVVLVVGLERMRAAARASVPEWAAGVCVGSRSLIVVRVDLARSGPTRSVLTTLRHEWVHLAWSRKAGAYVRRLPLWLEEGIAEEVGGGITVDGGARLDYAAAFGRLIPLEEIAKRWPPEAERAALAYRQGQSWVRYFRDRSGWDRLQFILRDLAAGKGESDSLAAGTPFQELVLEHSGSTLSHWNVTWKRHLRETSDPWFHLLWRDLTGTLLFLVSLIAAVAFFVIRRRRKRQIAALPDHPMPPGQTAVEEG